MPGGSTNPISLTGFVEKVAGTFHQAKTHMTENAHDLAKVAKFKEDGESNGPCVDLTIKVCMRIGFVPYESYLFSSLSVQVIHSLLLTSSRLLLMYTLAGIPKMDVLGTADPYFVAKIDDNVSMVFVFNSQIQSVTN